MNILIKSSLKNRRAASTVRSRLSSVLAAAGLRDAEISVLVVGDRAMRTLNRGYRGKDRTTDVLSFPFREGPFPDAAGRALGDLVLSWPVAERQAREAKEPLVREIDRLLVHGVLHLIGYDHERSGAEERRMRRREAAVLRRLER